MKKYLAFALALIMALALIPGAALADKGGWDGGHGGGGWGPGEGGNPGGGGGNPGGQQGGYLNQERWNSNIKVVWDTFTVSGTTKPGNNGAGVTAVTLNGTAVTWQDSNKTGAANGTALSRYYSSASSKNEQSVELAITAAEGYYVSRIVVACIDPQGLSPYRCNTWSAGNAYDVNFSLAQSVKQDDGKFKLPAQLNSKNFCHSSNGSNHGYYILIQVAPIPQPVYVEYDYGEILNMFPGDTKLADLFNNSAMWTTVASDNAYGSGEGNFVEYTKFAYNYSQPSDIQNWKHTTNSISVTAMAAVTPKNVRFLGWEVTYYAKCTKGGSNELTFSEQVGASSTIGERQNLNVYTHAKLVAKWEIDTTPTPTPEPGKATLVIRKEISGLEGSDTVPADYFIKVEIDGVERKINLSDMITNDYSVEVEANKPHTVVEIASGSISGYDHRRTGYSGLDANGTITIAEGKTRRVSIENKYVKHGTVIKPGKLTIKKTVEGVDVPDNYEVTVNVYNANKTVDLTFKLNKANSFSHTLELEEDRYYIKETTFTDINGYQLTGMDTQEHRPYDGNGINKIFRMSVSDNSEAAITIVNKYERVPEKAKLTVIKKVEGLENGVELPDDYKVTVTVGNQTITLTKNELSKTIQLDAGTYTVRETAKSNIDGYDLVKTEYSNLDANNGITLAEGGEKTVTVTVTNTYSKKQEPKAELTIKKTVEGVDIPEGYEVTVAVNGTEHKLNKANGFTLDIEVAPGKYTIEEKGCTEINGYYCEATTITINGKPTQEIELADMMEGKVQITNKYAEVQKPQNGKLTITKSFRGVYAYDLPRSFTVYVRPMNEDGMTLGSAMAVVLNRNSDNTYSATIEVGYNVYEVTEQSPYLSGYVFTGANYSAVSTGRDVAGYDLPRTNGIYVSTGENGTASVAVTNSYYYDYVPVIPPTKPLPPQTGDSGTAYMGIALCVMAAAAFVAARSRKRS